MEGSAGAGGEMGSKELREIKQWAEDIVLTAQAEKISRLLEQSAVESITIARTHKKPPLLVTFQFKDEKVEYELTLWGKN